MGGGLLKEAMVFMGAGNVSVPNTSKRINYFFFSQTGKTRHSDNIPSCHCNRLESLRNFYCEQAAVPDVFDLKLVLTAPPSVTNTNTNTQKNTI